MDNRKRQSPPTPTTAEGELRRKKRISTEDELKNQAKIQLIQDLHTDDLGDNGNTSFTDLTLAPYPPPSPWWLQYWPPPLWETTIVPQVPFETPPAPIVAPVPFETTPTAARDSPVPFETTLGAAAAIVALAPLETTPVAVNDAPVIPTRLVRRNRRSSEESGDLQVAPFPWATNRVAKVHSFDFLIANRITTISGSVRCKKCEGEFEIGFDLKEKYSKLWKYILEKKDGMCERAPGAWKNPILPHCNACRGENCVTPLLPGKNEEINWLFLFLGEWIGCCKLYQLKYFCKWTGNHRTGAKDRLIYLTYLDLCKQLNSP